MHLQMLGALKPPWHRSRCDNRSLYRSRRSLCAQFSNMQTARASFAEILRRTSTQPDRVCAGSMAAMQWGSEMPLPKGASRCGRGSSHPLTDHKVWEADKATSPVGYMTQCVMPSFATSWPSENCLGRSLPCMLRVCTCMRHHVACMPVISASNHRSERYGELHSPQQFGMR